MSELANNKDVKRGTLLVFIASLIYSFGGLFFKIIPYHSLAINSGRSILAGIVLLIFCKITKHKFVFNKVVIAAALCESATNTLFAIANKLTTAGNAIILQFTSPIFIILFSLLILKKKPSKRDLVASIVVIGGVVLFFIDSISAGNMVGNLLALASGATLAGMYMLKTTKDADPFTSVVLSVFINALIGLPWLVKTDFAAFGAKPLFYLFLFGVFEFGMAHVVFSIGIKTTPPVRASLIMGLEPIINPLIVALIYHEVLTTLAIIGAAIVFLSIFIYNYLNAKYPDPEDRS